MAGMAIGEEQFVPAQTLNDGAGQGIYAETPIEKAPANVAVGNRSDEYPLLILDILYRRRVGAVVAVDCHMVGQEEAQGWTRHHLDGQAQLVAVGGGPALDADQPAAMPVKPAAGLRRYLVGRGHIEQLP